MPQKTKSENEGSHFHCNKQQHSEAEVNVFIVNSVKKCGPQNTSSASAASVELSQTQPGATMYTRRGQDHVM